MAKEYYYFEEEEMMTFQGYIYTYLQDSRYHKRINGWYITADDAKLEGL